MKSRAELKRATSNVVDAAHPLHKREMTPPEIFDRNARRLRRGRTAGGGFFAEMMANDLLERLDGVQRAFRDALVVGAEPLIVEGLAKRGIAATVVDPSPRRGTPVEEDQLIFDGAPFDLILASGTLDTVSDLPGALLLLRRALKPDGIMLANFIGAPSLPSLRMAVAAADSSNDLAVARLHPQIDVRAAGDLLVRAGFALPVADLETVDVAYSSFGQLIDDLRAAAATNILIARHAVTRRWLAMASSAFEDMAGPDGRTRETLSYITLTGWAPDPTQPKPAKRGSSNTSLAAILDRSDQR